MMTQCIEALTTHSVVRSGASPSDIWSLYMAMQTGKLGSLMCLAMTVMCHIQSSAAIRRSNVSWYYIRLDDNSGRKWTGNQNHNGHPLLCPHGDLWGLYCGDLSKKWPRYNDTVLYKAGCHLTHTTDLQRGYTASSNEFGNKTNIVHWHGFQKVYRHIRFKMLC